MPSPDSQGEPGRTASSIVVRTFSTLEAADVAAGNLKARGIQCWLQADDCGGMIAAMDCVRGVKLFVRTEDFDAAQTLLDAPPVEAVSAVESADDTTRTP